jgi:hypothetical protein
MGSATIADELDATAARRSQSAEWERREISAAEFLKGLEM